LDISASQCLKKALRCLWEEGWTPSKMILGSRFPQFHDIFERLDVDFGIKWQSFLGQKSIHHPTNSAI
jgi:hypothetical protein